MGVRAEKKPVQVAVSHGQLSGLLTWPLLPRLRPQGTLRAEVGIWGPVVGGAL